MVLANWGFTHGQGLLEAKVKIHNEYILLVQLQGDRYCRGIEWIRERPATHEEYWENTKNEKIPQSFFQFDDEAVEFPSICIDANKKIEPVPIINMVTVFCINQRKYRKMQQ